MPKEYDGIKGLRLNEPTIGDDLTGIQFTSVIVSVLKHWPGSLSEW